MVCISRFSERILTAAGYYHLYSDTNGKIRIDFVFTCIHVLIVYVNQFRANIPPLFHLKVSGEFFLRGMKENFSKKWTERSINSEMVR